MAKHQRLALEVPKTLSPAQRAMLGDLVVEHIYDRTNRGLDAKGNPFPGYSKAYIASLDFKNGGKSKGAVNLQLSGDMLAALKLLSHKSGELRIGFESGTPENAKAEGNILGTYGQASPIKGKARNFLGIESRKLRELIASVKSWDED